MDFSNLSQQYKKELLENILPFWEKHSLDKEFGGFITCLDRKGDAYDTDKFIWLQAREVYMFSMLYNRLEKKENWLQMAVSGADFLMKYGHDRDFNWYFSTDRKGNALVEPYNIFSYTFATIAFGQLHLATGKAVYAEVAINTFNRILEKLDNPKGKWTKTVPGKRDLKNFALPMILCNLALEIEHLLPADTLNKFIDDCIHEVLEIFYRPELGGIIVENVTTSGELSDTFEGRLVNPGHAIEAMWFIMDLGLQLLNEILH